MEILIIGTGADIPPSGWGAVESIIWEHMQRIPKFGHTVDLLNTLDWWDLARQFKELNKQYDFIHSHYDIQFRYLKAISSNTTAKCAMSSHFPYIANEDMYGHFGFWKVMNYFTDDQHDHLNFCISQRDVEYFKAKGVPENKLYRLYIGASESISFLEKPEKPGQSIYLGKLCHRKGQANYGSIDSIDFVGNLNSEDVNFNPSVLKHYLGEWSKDKVYSNLTQYANLILLSQGENTPLVIREALIAGLGVVISESCQEELDPQPWITVIPQDKLLDLRYVEEKIKENRSISLEMRKEIRDYGISKFGWDACVKNYLNEVERAVCQKS